MSVCGGVWLSFGEGRHVSAWLNVGEGVHVSV